MMHNFIWGLGAVTLGLENLGTFSLAVNSVPYFNGIMHYDIADAANMLTNYMGVSYILCILVAVLADTWIGRYKSVLISGFFEFVVSSKKIPWSQYLFNILLKLLTILSVIKTRAVEEYLLHSTNYLCLPLLILIFRSL